MADQNPMGRSSGALTSPASEDATVESGVLGFVLQEHPDHLTVPELSLVLNGGPADFARKDAVERAIRELVGAGLLHICGSLVVPSRAAIYCHGLELG